MIWHSTWAVADHLERLRGPPVLCCRSCRWLHGSV